ncbi:MAG: methyltransferase domain-containing protein [Planctomycetales bacterium]|nr:methyltransferase domain-containing protein [Planctomycetales bacterium]
MSTIREKPAKFNLAQLRGFWDQQAQQHGTSHHASWSDRQVIGLEIEQVAQRLRAGDRVLDIGCANGFSTLELARRQSIFIHGVDYVPEMIRQAEVRRQRVDRSLCDRVQFAVGDITQLDFPDASFDKTVVIRVVINLDSWDSQARGLREAARTVRPGGLLLLSEATVQGHRKLNQLRDEWGLPPIPEPEFNRYLDEEAVCEALADEAELEELVNFASTYYVGTRVLKPLLAELLEREHLIADPDAHWNRWFAALPAGGDYGTQKLFVFRKR